jgi:hypothetical protein
MSILRALLASVPGGYSWTPIFITIDLSHGAVQSYRVHLLAVFLSVLLGNTADKNLGRPIIQSAVVTKFFIDRTGFFHATLSG